MVCAHWIVKSCPVLFCDYPNNHGRLIFHFLGVLYPEVIHPHCVCNIRIKPTLLHQAQVKVNLQLGVVSQLFYFLYTALCSQNM